jgi:hypothetical protein
MKHVYRKLLAATAIACLAWHCASGQEQMPNPTLKLKSEDTREVFVLKTNDIVQVSLPEKSNSGKPAENPVFDPDFIRLEDSKIVATKIGGAQGRQLYSSVRLFRLLRAGTTTLSIANKPYSLQPFTVTFRIQDRQAVLDGSLDNNLKSKPVVAALQKALSRVLSDGYGQISSAYLADKQTRTFFTPTAEECIRRRTEKDVPGNERLCVRAILKDAHKEPALRSGMTFEALSQDLSRRCANGELKAKSQLGGVSAYDAGDVLMDLGPCDKTVYACHLVFTVSKKKATP